MDEEAMVSYCATEVLDDLILEVVFEMHRRYKLGLAYICGVKAASEANSKRISTLDIVDIPELDIFGQPINAAISDTCVCTHCGRTVAATRYAPHLEKCMGSGRSSSRIASLRLSMYSGPGKPNGAPPSAYFVDDAFDSEDQDSTYSEKKVKKKKLSKKGANHSHEPSPATAPSASTPMETTPVPSPAPHTGLTINSSGFTVSASGKKIGRPRSEITIDSLKTKTAKMVRHLLETRCGVVLSSGVMCTNALKCELHTDEQRLAVRQHIRNTLGIGTRRAKKPPPPHDDAMDVYTAESEASNQSHPFDDGDGDEVMLDAGVVP